MYDRREVLELKLFLTKNSGHLGAVRQRVYTEFGEAGSVLISSSPDYKKVCSVGEAIEGILNFTTLLGLHGDCNEPGGFPDKLVWKCGG